MNTCIIIGNGASLRDVPLSWLKKYPTFGQNKIFLLRGFTPTYYVAVNPLVIQQSAEQINALECQAKFIAQQDIAFIPGAIPIVRTGLKKFHTRPPKAWEGHTVTFVSMQIAYWLNYRQILLVGVDHKYQYTGKPNKKTVWEGEDVNHFDPDYFKGQEWNNPDIARSEMAYRMARAAYERVGGRVINLTAGSALDVFEKGNINEW